MTNSRSDPGRETRRPVAAPSAGAAWPALRYAAWKDTCATVHLWTQIVGKIRLAQHAVAQPLLARDALRHRARPHHLADPLRQRVVRDRVRLHRPRASTIATSDGARAQVALRAADRSRTFYAAVMAALAELGIAVAINELPNEIAGRDPLRPRHARTPPTTPTARSASGACSCRPTACSSSSAPASSASAARCISSGAASTSR